MMMSYLGCDCETKKVGADITTSANSTKHHFHLSIPLCDLQTLNLSPPPSSLPFLHSGSTHHQRATGVLRPPLGACVCLLLQDLVQSCLRGLPPTHPFVGAPILQRHFQVQLQWRARLPPPRVLFPHTCTQDGWFLQPKRRPARLPRRTPPSNCICRCSRMRARLPLHILLLHTQVSR
jgi:hypothetical protein